MDSSEGSQSIYILENKTNILVVNSSNIMAPRSMLGLLLLLLFLLFLLLLLLWMFLWMLLVVLVVLRLIFCYIRITVIERTSASI
jgi:fatty acid desaturase